MRNSNASLAHQCQRAFCFFLAIALVLFVAPGIGAGQMHTLGEDVTQDSGQMPIKGHGPGSSAANASFWWYEDFADGDLQGWNVFCTGSRGAAIDLVRDDPMVTNSWCLRGFSPNQNEACGFIARSPDLMDLGLDVTQPYRISFRYKIPSIEGRWTYALIDRSAAFVLDRIYPERGYASFGYSPSGTVGDFYWLANLDLDRWHDLEIRVTPQATTQDFAVWIDEILVGSGRVPQQASHGMRLVLQDARIEAPGGYTYGAGYWDNFFVLGRSVGATAPDVNSPEIDIHQAGPNPFNPATVLAFQLPRAMQARLEVFDVRGRSVKTLTTGWHRAGEHRFTWRGTDAAGRSVASGIYRARLMAGGQTRSTTLTLVR